MNLKKTFLAICLIVCLAAIAGICAGDANQEDFDSGCCSFVIQEENETVFAFRQDAPVDGEGVIIHNGTIGGHDALVQEIDSSEAHFIHAIVTEDGWVVGHGGDSSNDSETLDLERIAGEMIASKKISSDSLNNIQKIFKKYDYGHFLIKAPGGRYAVVYSENCIVGTLKPGEFLVVPNEYANFSGGNYSRYGEDPVDAVVEICSYEDSGWNRRNLYSYDYKINDSENGTYGVDVYVTNDNGVNVGLDTSDIVNYCYFNDDLYNESDIPEYPDKLLIANHTFENGNPNSILEVLSHLDNVFWQR
jgi:hypothetical protein